MGDRKIIWIVIGLGLLAALLASFLFFGRPTDGDEGVGTDRVISDFPSSHTYTKASDQSGCLVYLFHQLGGQKEDWNDYVVNFTKIGCDVLAIDFSGHGEAEGDYEMFTEDDWQQLPQDAANVLEYGREKYPDYDHWMVGSSIGSNAALIAASTVPADVTGVVLLSPGLDYHGVKAGPASTKYDGPLFIATSSTDTSSFEATLEILDLSPSVALQTVEAPTGHGLELFETRPKLNTEIADFISTVNSL